MYTELPTTKDHVIAVKFTGSIDAADYRKLLPTIERKIQSQEKINLYWELENFQGWDWQSLWQEIQFDITYISSFRKVAIVGDKSLEQTVVGFIKPFVPFKIKFFSPEDKNTAMEWIES